MKLMLGGVYLHPNGQMPAYEWNFSDVNPPVHAFATLFLQRTEQALRGETDLDFLRAVFNKLLLNFTWWVNRKDRFGKNVFEGRLPRPRQHRRLRPQRAAADGRPPGTGRRHGLDGALQPEYAGARGRARDARPHLRGHGRQVRRAFLLHRRGHEPARAGRHVGRGGRLLLRPAAPAGRHCYPAQGTLDGRASSLVRRDGHRAVAAGPDPRSHGHVSAAPPPDTRARRKHAPDGARPLRSGGPGHDRAGQRAAVAPDPDQNARRERVPEPARNSRAVQGPRAASVRLPRAGPGISGGLPAGRVRTPACSAATRTGGGPSGCR